MDRIGNKFEQIAGRLRTRITTGTYRPGEALPPLAVLQEEMGCAVKTIRKGIAILEAEGLVRTVPGKGNYVR